MLLEMLNREVPEPFVEHCRGLGAGGGTTRPVPAPLRDTPEDIAGQIAVIKKFEKTLRWVSRWAGCAWVTAQCTGRLAVYRCPAMWRLWRAGSLKKPAATQPAPQPTHPALSTPACPPSPKRTLQCNHKSVVCAWEGWWWVSFRSAVLAHPQQYPPNAPTPE